MLSFGRDVKVRSHVPVLYTEHVKGPVVSLEINVNLPESYALWGALVIWAIGSYDK